MGNLQLGYEADFIVLNPSATPLLARKTAQANSLDELLFVMIVLGDDRLVEKTVISQAGLIESSTALVGDAVNRRFVCANCGPSE